MAITEKLRREAGPSQGGPRAPHRAGALHGEPHRARHGVDGGRPEPVRPREDRRRSTRRRRPRCRASSPCFTAADLEDEWGGPLPFVWPITEDIKVPVHWPLTKDKARLPGRRRRRRAGRDPRAGRGRRRGGRGRLVEPLDAVTDSRRRRRTSVVIHEDLGTNVVVHWSHGGGGDQSVFDTADVVVKERYVSPGSSRTRSRRVPASRSRSRRWVSSR